MTRVAIYDTTLRDGTQGEGISLSVDDKLRISKKMDELGVAYIEGGWPGSNPKDKEFFQVSRGLKLKNAKIVAFSSTRRANMTCAEDPNIQELAGCGTDAVAIFGKAWDMHVQEALKVSLETNLEMIVDTIAYFKSLDKEVIFDAEHFFDGYLHNPEYALKVVQAAAKAGADWIVPCDTNGGAMIDQIQKIITILKDVLEVPLGIHAHNDSDLAVANSLTAVMAGARMVHGTVNGIGERCGNANLMSIIPNLQLKMDYNCVSSQQLEQLTEVSKYVNELANIVPNNQQPFVGQSAFAHKAGVHVSAVAKNPATYEHMDPVAVGNKRRVLVSELSGISNLKYKAQELDLAIDTDDIACNREAIKQIKDLEAEGYQYEGAEASLELLLRRLFGCYQDYFQLDTFKILMEKKGAQEMISEAMIKLKVDGQNVHTAAEGNGPVNALDNALRKALSEFYPEINKIHLADYKVRVLEGSDGTMAKVRVLIETKDETENWNTIGVSENIMEASWQALAESINYALLKAQQKKNSL